MEVIAIGCDHAGFEAKELLKEWLEARGYAYLDHGCFSTESVHYPEYAHAVAHEVAEGDYQRGILICGTGIGMSIAANKTPGIRAALCHDAFTAQASREHNNANILCMGARVLEPAQMEEIVDIWLKTPFAGGRHQLRIDMIE